MDLSKRNIFIYKRTHTGDPTHLGVFGESGDCEGHLRNNLDIVIGIGGFGDTSKSHGINRKINWIGVGAKEIKAEEKCHNEIPKDKDCHKKIETVVSSCAPSSCSKNLPESQSNSEYRGPIWEFEKFELYEEKGPLLADYAPNLASRFYDSENPPRHFKDMEKLDKEERNEIDRILRNFISGKFENHLKCSA